MYGKQTECAIAAMSRLAEVYDGGETYLSTADIAQSRGLQQAYLKNVLSILSQSGLVTGMRGPGGGASLARDPKTITLDDVFILFETYDDSDRCPFLGERSASDTQCPLSAKLESIRKAMDNLLLETTFDVFRLAHESRGHTPDHPDWQRTSKERESYRAPKSQSTRRMMFRCLANR